MKTIRPNAEEFAKCLEDLRAYYAWNIRVLLGIGLLSMNEKYPGVPG